jgi:two-component system, NtrC family, response regulator
MRSGMSDRPTSVLVVDDDASVTASLALLLKQAGFAHRVASSPAEAIAALERDAFDLVIQDMNFTRTTTGEEGLQLLREIRRRNAVIPIVLITAWGSVSLAVAGMKAGASDFVTKPWDNQQLIQVLRMALSLSAIRRESSQREPANRALGFEALVGATPALMRVLDYAARVCKTDATILITGESGTGKEMLTDAIHANSARAAGPLVKVNMGAIVPSLFESEMFGHVRGAFTDAKDDRVGFFEQADGGTIFLDEIAELDPTSQVKLLRVLQDREFRRVGSSKTRRADFRVIAATNRNVERLVAQGKFREDLYYRLNLITLQLPPLRARTGDVRPLVEAQLLDLCQKYGWPSLECAPDALEWLDAQSWPGNIRQLRQCVERVALLSGQRRLVRADFESLVNAGGVASAPDVVGESATLEALERATIQKAMAKAGDNITRAAEILGVSRAALYRRLAKHGLVRE